MNGLNFNWQLIPAFLAVFEQGSLMGAARQLGSSQPTMGRHMAELEAQLGTVLFERTGRGLAPTAAAQRLADAARTMENGAHALLRAVNQTRHTVSGTVRLSASQPVACVLLPPVLARMRLELPDVQVELVVSNTVSNLLRREADMAVRMVRPEQSSLVARRIGGVAIGVCAHRSYLQRRGTPRQASELELHDLIGYDRGEDIARGLAAMGLSVPPERFALRTDDLMAYWAAVRAGMGVGFVADYLRQEDAEVLPLLTSVRIPSLPVWLVVHREVRGNALVRAVFDFLARELPPLF
jgi:DNA-binding transcriptional LysR family regulator